MALDVTRDVMPVQRRGEQAIVRERRHAIPRRNFTIEERKGYTSYHYGSPAFSELGQEYHTAPLRATITTYKLPAAEPAAPIIRAPIPVTGTLPPLSPEVARVLSGAMQSSPTFEQEQAAEKKGGAKLWGGLGLAALGIGGGVLAGLKWGALATGMKVAAGAAAAGAVIGGGALAASGVKEAAEEAGEEAGGELTTTETGEVILLAPGATIAARASKLRGILEMRTPPAEITPFEIDLMTEYSGSIVSALQKPHSSLVAEFAPLTKSGGSGQMDAFKAWANGTWADPARLPGYHHGPIRGLRMVPPGLTDAHGVPKWVEVGKVECHLYEWKAGGRGNIHDPAGEPISAWEHVMTLWDWDNKKICSVKHWRYKAPRGRKHWHAMFGWSNGGIPNYLQRYSSRHRSERHQAYIVWHNNYNTYYNGAPPLGYYFNPFTCPYLQDITAPSVLTSVDSAGNQVVPSFIDTEFQKVDKHVRGPMGAVIQGYRQLRSMSPETILMQFDGPESIFHLVNDTVSPDAYKGWWAQVVDWVGSIFGVASFVCEVAMPVITAINPAVAAGLGAALRGVAMGLEIAETTVQDPASGAVRILDAFKMSPNRLQDWLQEGWSGVTDAYGAIEELVTGWADSNGLMLGDIGSTVTEVGGELIRDVLTPSEQFFWFRDLVYNGNQQKLVATINDSTSVPWSIVKDFYMLNRTLDPAKMWGDADWDVWPEPDLLKLYSGPMTSD